MKKLTIALLASALSLFAVPAFAWDQTAMNQQIDQTNFIIDDDCSGTLIDKDNAYILTANHCVSDQFEIIEKEVPDKDHPGAVKTVKIKISKPGTVSQLVFNGSRPVAKTSTVYKVKAHDADHDLAVVQLAAKPSNTLASSPSCTEPVRGDTVWAVGNPLVRFYSTVTKGTVTSVQRDYRMIGIDQNGGDDETENQPGDNGLLQHDAAIAPGNSGGALYNDKGELIGVNIRGTRIGAIYLAVPLDDIRKFLTDNKVTLADCPAAAQ